MLPLLGNEGYLARDILALLVWAVFAAKYINLCMGVVSVHDR